MKTPLLPTLALVALAAVTAHTVRAGVLAADDFSYPDGALVGKGSAGNGWAGAWTNYFGNNTSRISVTNGVVSGQANPSQRMYRQLDAAVAAITNDRAANDGTTIHVGIDWKVGVRYGGFELVNPAFSDDSSLRLQLGANTTTGGPRLVTGATTLVPSGNFGSIAEVDRYIMAITFDTTNGDKVELFQNGVSIGSAQDVSYNFAFNRVGFGVFRDENPGTIPHADNLVIATTFAAAIPARTWVGSSAGMNTAANWSPSGVPSATAGDSMFFDGSGTASDITFPGGTFSGNNGLGGLAMASTQAAALTINNSGAANSVFRLRDGARFTIGAGAGAFSFGTEGNAFFLNPASSGTNTFTNHSSNVATIGDRVQINASGGASAGGSRVVFDGSGDWLVSGVTTTAVTRGLIKNGSGTLTLAGDNAHTAITTVNEGTLALAHVNAVKNSTLDTGAAGTRQVTFAVAGTNTYNLGGLAGSMDIALDANSLGIGANNASTSFDGVLTGSGSVTKTGSGTLTLSGSNTHTGTTRVNGGTLALANINALQNSTLHTGNLGSRQVTFTVAGSNTYHLGGLDGRRDLDLDTNSLIIGSNNANTLYYGALSGSGDVTKTGSGTLTLARGTHTHTGTTTVASGTLSLVGCGLSSPVVVNDGTILGLNPAAPVTSTGNLTLDAGARIRITGSTTGAGSYTLFTTTGTITGTPVLENPSSSRHLLLEGGNTLKLVINYTYTWQGASADMGVAENWDPTAVPSASTGDTMLFDGSGSDNDITFPGGTFSSNNGLGGLTMTSAQTAALTIDNSGAAGSVFRLRAGARLTIAAGAGAFSFGTGGNWFYLNPASSGTNTFTNNSSNLATIGDRVKINASTGTGGLLAFDGSGDWRVSGDTTTAVTRGLIKNGSGTLTLAGDNSHTGPTRLNAGTLALAHLNAVKSSTLVIDASGSPQLIFAVPGSNTYHLGGLSGSGDLALGANSLSIGANNASTTFAGAFSGRGSVTKTGTGTLTLTGTRSHTGTTTVAAGTLALVAANLNSTVTINHGAFLGLTPAAPASSTRNLTLDAGSRIRVTDIPTAGNHILFTTTGTITGTPVPDSPMAGFGLVVVGGNSLHLVSRDYLDWAARFPGVDLSDPDADFDDDGVSNFHEFLFDLDPADASSNDPIVVPFNSDTGTLSFTRRDPAITGSFNKVWYSTDLVWWQWDVNALLTPVAAADDVQTVTVQISDHLLDEPRLFVQIGAHFATDTSAPDPNLRLLAGGANASLTLAVPSRNQRELNAGGAWRGVITVDFEGTITGGKGRIILDVVDPGNGQVLATLVGDVAHWSARWWVEIPPDVWEQLEGKSIELRLRNVTRNAVVIGEPRFAHVNLAPDSKLIGGANGASGPDKLGAGLLGFQALTEHQKNVLSVMSVRAGSPAAGQQLRQGDVILAVRGRPLPVNSVSAGWHWFHHSHEAVIGRETEAALAAGETTLPLTVLRDGVPADLHVPLNRQAAFTTMNPADDPEAARVLDDCLAFLVRTQRADGSWSGNIIHTTFSALAMLATGEPEHRERARNAVLWAQAHHGLTNYGSLGYWRSAYAGLLYTEWYLTTGDASVLPNIEAICNQARNGWLISRWDIPALGHDHGGLPYNSGGLVAPAAHLLVVEALAIRGGLQSGIWEIILPYMERSWSNPATGGHGALGYYPAQRDNSQHWSRSGLFAMAAHLRGERTDMRDAMIQSMHERYPWIRNSHAYGEPGGALGLLALNLVAPEIHAEVIREYAWWFSLAWEPGYGLRYTTPHEGSPYMGEESIINAAYALVLQAPRRNLHLTGKPQ